MSSRRAAGPMIAMLAVMTVPAGAGAGAVTAERGARFVQAPREVRAGDAIAVSVRGLVPSRQVDDAARGARYRLTIDQLAEDRVHGRPCVRVVDTSFGAGSRARTVTWRGSFPHTLRCYDGRTGRPGHLIPVTPGAYRLVVGIKTSKGTWDPRGSVLVRRVVVR